MTYSTAKIEPKLNDMIEDPIVKLLMQRDGVSRENLLPLLSEAALRLQETTLQAAE